MSGGGPGYEPFEGKPSPAELLLPARRERLQEVIAQRTRTVTVLLDQLEDTFNMAAVLRTCEGMGLQDVHLVRNKKHPWSPNSRVTQGCDKWLDLYQYAEPVEAVRALQAKGYKVWASAIREGATSLYDLKFDQKIAMVFGNERFGVGDELLDAVDGVFWIPMRGFSQSFNISAAASACITRAVAWRHEHLGPQGDLSDAEKAELTQRFEFLSVKQRGRLYGHTK
jgi:tRNA (guanosine-2'-O-)-methyltransferase